MNKIIISIVCMLLALIALCSVAHAKIIADCVTDFSRTQGYKGWYYGYYQDTFNSASFREMTIFDTFPSGTQYWSIDYSKYHTSVWDYGMHPNGPTSLEGRLAVEQWSVRRWVSTVSGPVILSGQFAHHSWGDYTLGGDGATAHIFVDGTEVWSQWVSGYDQVDVNYNISAVCHVGSIIDFTVSPGADDGYDHFKFTSTVNLVPEPSSILALLCGIGGIIIRLKSK